jgi:RNA polymerase subunit RPABC4/transcription elongation factor Spt4
MSFLAHSGLSKVLSGITSVDEVLRVAATDEDYASLCPSCGTSLAGDFIACPGCDHPVGHHCPECKRAIDPEWSFCPYCRRELAGTPHTEGT